MTTPQDVLDAIDKLEETDQATVKDYVTKLETTIQDLEVKLADAGVEIKEEEKVEEEVVEEEEMLEPDFPPLYESGEDFEKAAEHKQNASDLKGQGKWEEALEEYTQAVLCAEPSALLYANRAICLLKLNRPRAAERDCNQALHINPDSAKALRMRGKARKELERWQEARHDLAEAQQIDFDEGTVEDLKYVSEKVAELDKERVAEKLKKEEELKKRHEELKKAREKQAKEEATGTSSSTSASTSGMPGGGSMPGMPAGMAGLMSTLMSDPEIAAGLQNPKVMAAMSSLMSNPTELMSNPGKMQELMADPEVGPVLQKIMAKLGPGMAGGAGGGGGMPADNDEIPNLDGDDDDDDDMPDLD